MAQTQKYIFNLGLANTADPGSDLKTIGWQNEQILDSAPLNTYMAQASNWAGDFKSISTASDTTLNIPGSTSSIAFDFIQLTNAAGCSVNIDLTTIGTSILSLGQTITLWNNTSAYSQYLVNGANAQPIFPGEFVRLFILNNTTVINLTDVTSQVPPGTVRFTFNNSLQRGWLLLNLENAMGPTTIGKAGANYSSPDYLNLYTALWTPRPVESPEPLFPVLGGRGSSAAADFAANKLIVLDNIFRAVPAFQAGNNAGEMWGAEEVIIDIGHMPSHTHAVHDPGHFHGTTPVNPTVYQPGSHGATGGGNLDIATLQISPDLTNISLGNTGDGGALDTRPPTVTPYTFLKL